MSALAADVKPTDAIIGPMESRTFPDAWFATPGRVASATKVIAFDDRGALQITAEGGITFIGRKCPISIDAARVRGVELVRQEIPWVAYAFLFVLLALLAIFGSGGAGLGGTAAIIATTTVSMFLASLVAWSTKWVKVEWETVDGVRQSACFAHAGAMGWAGIFGGTVAIHDALADRE